MIGFEMSKFCAIIAFLLSQTFEYQVLYTFVLFQQMIRVEQLPGAPLAQLVLQGRCWGVDPRPAPLEGVPGPL